MKRDAEEANERYEKLKAQVVHDRLFSGSSRSGGSERVYRRTVPDDDVWCPPDPKRGKSAGSVERPALESRFEVSAAFGAVHTELTNNGRVVEYYPQENVLFYSTEFPNKKYGVVMHSLMDTGFKAPMKLYHTGTIRDVAAGGDGGTLITASSDKTVKLCSIKTRNEIVECHTPSDVWSCCWDANDPRYFYCGRQDGEVCMYDCRKLNSFVCSAHPPAKTQIHSLCSLRMPDGEVGLIVGSVKGISYMHGTRAKIEDAGWVQEEKCIGISGLHESFGQTFIAASFRGEAETTHRIYVVEPRMTYRKNARGILEQASEFKNNVFSTLMAKPGLVSGQNGQMFLVTNNGLTPELILWSPDDDGKPAVIKSSLSAKSYVRHPALSITSFEKDKTPYFVTSSKNEVVIYGGLT